MKAEVTKKTNQQLGEISQKRKDDGRSDWAHQHILSPIVDKLYKKECKPTKESRRLVEVCASCGCACCWHGKFMCDNSTNSGTIMKTVAELDALDKEDKIHYSKERLLLVCGAGAPHGYREVEDEKLD